MRYLRYPLYLLLLAALLFILLLLIGTLSDYRPEVETVLHENEGAESLTDSVFTIMIWNIGYAGLGEKMDFFYDGGKGVRPDRPSSVNNLSGIMDYLSTLDTCDFYLLQEVDIRSKRSYRINQLDSLEKVLKTGYTSFGKNFDVFFNPAPPRAPLGNIHSGIASLSRHQPLSSARYSFPGNYSWTMGVFMLDRCFTIDRYPVAGSRELLVINTHYSAYDDGTLRKGQMDFLSGYLTEEYSKGNYVIVGGDWNQTPPGFVPEFEYDEFDTIQLSYIGENYLPAGWKWLYDAGVPTNRRVGIPYLAGVSRTTVIDFFLLSPNLEPLLISGVDLRFKYSDHQPVIARFRLR
jgi:endonuclease/exonuclease/phosphatase family metal-dependent hydrolase